MAEFNRSTTPP